MAVALLVLATCTGVMFDRPLLPVAWALGVVLLWLYSYSPGRLSYRGHGEWVAGLGVGVLLPLIGWYAQTGELAAFPWLALVPLFLLGLASNINTALPDHVADARVAKRTWSVRYGSARARKHSLQLLAIAVLFTPWVLPGAAKSTWLAVECVPLLLVLLNARQLRRADPADPPQCSRFVFRNGLAGTALMVGWIVALSLREFGSS
jgi:1,4-dihydroxy-2-naphthoate octaprenyltransferase